jgi:hypothetical protein
MYGAMSNRSFKDEAMDNKNQKSWHHAEKIQKLIDGVLNNRGDSNPQLRRAVQQRAASYAGRLPESSRQLPQEIGT